jgi:hypothetical protein
MKKYALIMLCVCFFLGGCGPAPARQGVMDTAGESQVKIREMQTRYFDSTDKKKTLESVLETLQDLGFVINSASLDLGSVSATKLSGNTMRMTVTVTPRGKRMAVRANAQRGAQAVTDPKAYQNFFEALSKSMFLQADPNE